MENSIRIKQVTRNILVMFSLLVVSYAFLSLIKQHALISAFANVLAIILGTGIVFNATNKLRQQGFSFNFDSLKSPVYSLIAGFILVCTATFFHIESNLPLSLQHDHNVQDVEIRY